MPVSNPRRVTFCGFLMKSIIQLWRRASKLRASDTLCIISLLPPCLISKTLIEGTFVAMGSSKITTMVCFIVGSV